MRRTPKMKTFARAGLDACRALVDSVCAQLVSSGGCVGGKKAANACTFAAAGGQSLRLLGPGAVCRLSVRLRADDLVQALRSTVLRMAFDGRETVWVPVGDFFGTGNRLKPYGTYFTSVSADTVLTCRWVMPYREDCRIALENVRGDRVQASLEADVCPWQWDDRSMYFGAGWTEYNRLYTGATRDMEGTLAQRDVNFVSLRGRGVYVGDALTVFNTVADWWGEGDEKVYVDGESFPSHFGTGTEDYYGYAWCMYPPFAQPFIAQPDGSGDTQPGHVANLRFRSLDAIPFGSSLVFDMELWHWASTYVNYAPTTFWYMLPGGMSNRGEAAREAALPVARHKHDLVPCTPDSAGTVEGEFMDIRLTGGEERSQSMPHMGWSNGAQFFWRGGRAGRHGPVGFPRGAGRVVRPDGLRHASTRLRLFCRVVGRGGANGGPLCSHLGHLSLELGARAPATGHELARVPPAPKEPRLDQQPAGDRPDCGQEDTPTHVETRHALSPTPPSRFYSACRCGHAGDGYAVMRQGMLCLYNLLNFICNINNN